MGEYGALVDDCKVFGCVYDDIVDGGHPDRLHKQEQKLFGMTTTADEASFLDHITLLGAAGEIASQCRERVGNGYAPKTVLVHTLKAIEGLRPLSAQIFPGLQSLRAHIHVSRAHACL